jgi:hypothetical protein
MTIISSLNKVDPLGRVCWLLNAMELGVGPHGSRRTTATAMVNWCVRSHRCRNHPLLLLFLPVCCRRHCTSCLHDVPARMMQQNKRFDVEAAKPTAPMPMEMLFLTTLLGRHHQLPRTLPYIFIRRTQTTSNPQCLSTTTRHDLNKGWQWQWCPTPGAAANNGHTKYWLNGVSKGTGSGAPWQ